MFDMIKELDLQTFVESYTAELPKILEKWIREKADDSPKSAAERINKHVNTIYKWLNGKTYPTALDIANICKVFNLDPRYFYPELEINSIKEAKELKRILDFSWYSSINKKGIYKILEEEDEEFAEKVLSMMELMRR